MTQTDIIFEPSPVPPRLCNDPSTIEQRWEAFDHQHPEVWRAFRDAALRRIERGDKYVSAKGVWEDLRETLKVQTGSAPKLNNDYTCIYARVFAQEYPQHAGVFRFRRRRDEVE